jgi:hypothetical protein
MLSAPPSTSVAFVVDEQYFWHRSVADFGPSVEPGEQLETPAARRRLLQLVDRLGLRRSMGSAHQVSRARSGAWLPRRSRIVSE